MTTNPTARIGASNHVVEQQTSKLPFLGSDALEKLLRDYSFQTVLDIGCGDGQQAETFRKNGKNVVTLSMDSVNGYMPDITGCFENTTFDKRFDLIWACHVLEHTVNPISFLHKIFNTLTDDGIAAITVPPLKHMIVSGHINLYNAGLLLYHLVCAGFDCSACSYKVYGYNISVIARKKAMEFPFPGYPLPLTDLGKYFPFPVAPTGFDGRLPSSANW